jgi:hypothetical protein
MCLRWHESETYVLLLPAKSIIVEEGSASARTSNEVTKVFDGLVISKLRNLAEALLITRTYCNIVIPK